MIGTTPKGWARMLAGALATSAILAIGAAGAGAQETVYNNRPSPLPGNLPSVGFEATSTSEFGGEVEFPALTPRRNPTINVSMSSWACESGGATDNTCKSLPGSRFSEPVTLNIYEVGPLNTVGAKVATVTETFNMPFRPTASKKCTTGESKGGWHPPECFHGKLFNIRFKLNGKVLPAEKAIVSVAYNTSDYGYEKQRPKPCNSTSLGCPYDSLNVAVTEPTETSPSVGKYPDEEEVFVYSTWQEMYCGNALATGVFGPSGKCWKDEQPVLEIKAS